MHKSSGLRKKRAIPKPKHLGPEYGEPFADPAVVAAYHHRPPYPAGVFTILRSLVGQPSVGLDLGCGTGDVARQLAQIVDVVDAVDCSQGMIEQGKRLPGGDHSNLCWILGRAEEVTLPRSSYGLVTAGESLHWMDWDRLLPRLDELLVPGGYLAIIGRSEGPTPWWEDLLSLIRRYSTNRDFQPYSLVVELEKRGLFEPCGVKQTDPLPFRQSVASYVESIHSRNGSSQTIYASVQLIHGWQDLFGRDFRCSDGVGSGAIDDQLGETSSVPAAQFVKNEGRVEPIKR